jgi:2-oxoglutarate ferredoxin oxidoreductase subunit alpha
VTPSDMIPMTLSKPNLPPGEYYFSGNEAAVEAAIDAGCLFYAGYPITPSSDIMEGMSVKMPQMGGVFVQMEDEIASICSVIGAVWAGAKGMTATSGPGFSLMQEALGYAAFTETPLVIMDIQRAGPCTGQATRTASGDHMQAKWGSHGDYQVISYCPWSVQEMYDYSIRAFNQAERFRVPVIVSAEEAIAHLREKTSIPAKIQLENRKKEKGAAPFDTEAVDGVPPMPAFGEGENLMVTGSTHDGMGFRKTEDPQIHQKLVERINYKILNHREQIVETDSLFTDDAELLIVAYGFTARSSAFAVNRLRQQGVKVGLLRLKTIWPFAEHVLKRFNGIRKVLVPEMNLGQIVGEVGKHLSTEVISLTQVNGDVINPLAIMDKVREVY